MGCCCKVAEKMRTALVFIFAVTTTMAGKNYIIETGDAEPKKAEEDYVAFETEGACPTATPDSFSECSSRQKGLSCEYGHFTCCGKTHASSKYSCDGRAWIGLAFGFHCPSPCP